MSKVKEITFKIFSYIFALIRLFIIILATLLIGIQKILFDGVQIDNLVLSCKPLLVDLDKLSYLDKLGFNNIDVDMSDKLIDDILTNEGDINDDIDDESDGEDI